MIFFLSIALLIGCWYAIHNNSGHGCTLSLVAFVIALAIFDTAALCFPFTHPGLFVGAYILMLCIGALYAWIDMNFWLKKVAVAAQDLINKDYEQISAHDIRAQLHSNYNTLTNIVEYPFESYPPNLKTRSCLDMIATRIFWWPFHLLDSLLTDWLVRGVENIAHLTSDYLRKEADKILPMTDEWKIQQRQREKIRTRGGEDFPRDMALSETRHTE